MIISGWPSDAKEAVLTVNGSAVNDDLVSITYTDDLCGGDSAMVIGAAAAARLRIVIDHPSASYAGASLAVSIGGVPLGCFVVTDATEKDGRLTLDAVDALGTSAMQEAYTPSASTGTALGVAREICTAAGLTLGDVSGITDVAVEGLKEGSTRLEMLGAMAAVLGRNAHIDRYGALVFRWYSAPAGLAATIEDAGNGHIVIHGPTAEDPSGDGHVIVSYGVRVTDTGDGRIVVTSCGDYDVAAEDTYAGDPSKKLADVTLGRIDCTAAVTTVNTDTDDQGGTITTEETETRDLTAGAGTAGITLQCDYMTQSILDGIYARIGGFVYRPMSLSFYGDCRVETGDILRVTERDGTSYSVPVSSVVHTWDGGVRTTVTAAGGQTAASVPMGPTAAAVAQLNAELTRAKNQEAQNVSVLNSRIGRETTARENAVAALAQALASSGGMYETTETPAGGGTIYCLHDKPTLADSVIVLKLTNQALGISTDGGQTYPTGWNFVTGDTITNVLSAIGVNANWINAGSVTVLDANGNVVFQADKDNHYTILGGAGAKLFGQMNVYTASDVGTLGGYMGYMAGSHGFSDGTTEITNGIALINQDSSRYLIVTDAGIRLTEDTGAGVYRAYLADGKFRLESDLLMEGAHNSNLRMLGARAQIPENADLTSVTYHKNPRNYAQYNSGYYVRNTPRGASGYGAFLLDVENASGAPDSSDGTWLYRRQRLQYLGSPVVWTREWSTDGNAAWSYGDWLSDRFERVWENPTPDSSFSSGTIALPDGTGRKWYNLFMIVCRQTSLSNGDYDLTAMLYAPKGKVSSTYTQFGYYIMVSGTRTWYSGWRVFSVDRSTEALRNALAFTVGDGYDSSVTLNNDYLIPKAIYAMAVDET